MMTAVDENGVKIRISVKDTRLTNGEYVAESKGRKYTHKFESDWDEFI